MKTKQPQPPARQRTAKPRSDAQRLKSSAPKAKKTGAKRGGARRGAGKHSYKPTDADRHTVLAMTAAGIKQEEIGPCIGTDGLSDATLRKYFARELKIGVTKVHGLCVAGIVSAMQAGEAWALCFYAKTRMGWREKSALDEVTEITVKRLVGVAIEDV